MEQKPRQLQAHLRKIGPRITENLVCLSVPVPTENINEMRQQALQNVQGKILIEALAALLKLYGGVNLDTLRTLAEKELNTFRFSKFGTTTIISPDGRSIEKRPAVVSMTDDTEAHKIVIQDEILRHYLLEISLVAQGYILPTLETVVIEHRLTEDFFENLCKQAAIVPPNRIKAWGRMLFADMNLILMM